MFKELFKKYIDFSLPKHRFLETALDGVNDLEEAFKVVSKKMVLTDYVIKEITIESKSWDKSKAADVEKAKLDDEAAKAAAEEEAAKVKAENLKAAGKAKKQGEQPLF